MFVCRQAGGCPKVLPLGGLGQHEADEGSNAEPAHRVEEEQQQRVHQTRRTTET
jgi:hypothetical protein